MNDDALAEYTYLWDGSCPGWVLLRAPELSGGYCVFHKTGQMLLHIESSSINDAVCSKMKESGCEILEEPPAKDVTVSPA